MLHSYGGNVVKVRGWQTAFCPYIWTSDVEFKLLMIILNGGPAHTLLSFFVCVIKLC